ncbi:MAG: cytochrome c [Candidatus Tectomicrobia bacterium]|nr:cytochrome c [Candidatus Tectomicrobia bacterium]
MIRKRSMLGMAVLVVVCLSIPLSNALAQKDENYLTYRQKVMAGIGANWAATGVSLKNNLPSKANIGVHAEAIHNASKLIAGAFKKEITEGKTDAKPDIWQDWQKFADAAKKLGEESGKLVEVAESGDMEALGAQVKATGKACGDCHKPFRKPKEERFKR